MEVVIQVIFGIDPPAASSGRESDSLVSRSTSCYRLSSTRTATGEPRRAGLRIRHRRCFAADCIRRAPAPPPRGGATRAWFSSMPSSLAAPDTQGRSPVGGPCAHDAHGVRDDGQFHVAELDTLSQRMPAGRSVLSPTDSGRAAPSGP